MRRKIVMVLLCGLLSVSLFACSNKDQQTKESSGTAIMAESETEPDTKTDTKSETYTLDTTKSEAKPSAEETAEAEDSEKEAVVKGTPVVTSVNETVYATCSLNVRFGPGTSYDVVGNLSTGDSVKRTGTTAEGWSVIEYNNTTCYASSQYLTTEKVESPAAVSDSISYPLSYGDATCSITVNKEWFQNAYCCPTN